MAYSKPGLWLPTVKVEAETVTRNHRKDCDVCGKAPVRRRLKIHLGSGRNGSTKILCIDCGDTWVERRIEEANNLQVFLREGAGCVRLPAIKCDPSYREPKERKV